DTVEQFLYVFITAQALHGFVGIEVFQYPRVLCDMHRRVVCRVFFSLYLEPLYHGGESPYGTGASAVEVGRGIADDFPRGDLPFVGCHADAVERGIAYSPARVVDYPFKGLFVVRVEGEPEVGDEVFDFLTLVERRTPVNLVGDIDFPECLLHGARLRIGTVQDGEIAVVAAMQRALLSDRFRHDLP